MRGKSLALLALMAALALVAPGGTQSSEAEPGVAIATDQIMAGLYAPQQWYSRAHINEVNNASSKKVSIGGIWFDITDRTDNLTYLLEEIWSVEATPFVNIHLPASASAIASGVFDPQIANMADAIVSWLDKGGERSVMLAPMPEMNGDWIPYGVDPTNFKPAFRRFVEVANRNGSPDWNLRWVFAPNGWSTPPHRMVNYYPGADVVDLVGISAYNWGTNVPGGSWTTVAQAMGPALDEARTFAL